jgi:glycolate oxidase iron-sulfur subunit
MTELLEHHAPVAPRPRGILPVDEDELVACVACGLCLPHCPTYRVSGLESESPRGRIAAMREVELEGAPDRRRIRRVDGDVRAVPGLRSGMPVDGAVRAPHGGHPGGARGKGGGAAPVVAAGRGVGRVRGRAPRHRLLISLTWLTLVGQRLHLVPRRFGLPKLSARSLRAPLVADATGDAVLFPGCVMDAWQRDVHRAALTVMRAAGARATLPGRGADCCGALHAHAGRISEARRLARRVIRSMTGDAPIVVDSAGCGAAMKDYGRLLGTPDAVAFSARVRDFSEWLAAQPPLALRDTGTVAVVQDPCHLRHVQHAQGYVRTVLGPAYALRDTDDDGLCCGAGGAYAVVQPALANDIRTRKVQSIRRAAAPIGVTNVGRHSSSRPTPGARCTSQLPASPFAIPRSCSPLPWSHHWRHGMLDADAIVERLRAIEEDLRDLAYERLRAPPKTATPAPPPTSAACCRPAVPSSAPSTR